MAGWKGIDLRCPHTHRVTVALPAISFGYGHWEGGWKCLACDHLESWRWIAHTAEAVESVLLTCENCSNSWPVDDAEGQRLLEAGDVALVGTGGYRKFSAICANCQRRFLSEARRAKKREVPMEVETREIRNMAMALREADPSLSLEDSIHLAVEKFTDPHKERNAAFRAYLLEHDG